MLTKGCEQPTAEFNENWAEVERVSPVKSYVPTSNCLLTEDNKIK